MTITYEELYSAVVTILVLLLFGFMAGMVGRMRGRHSVAAPATTGHPQFDRAFRIHANTLEQMMLFLPLLWLATLLYRDIAWLPALLGIIFLIGRIIYMQRYMADPKSRGLGVMIGMLANLGLLIVALVGLVQTWTVLSAT